MITKFRVSGMSCGHCVRAVEQELKGVDGVKSVEVSLERGEAIVAHDGQIEPLIAAIEEAGYAAEVM